MMSQSFSWKDLAEKAKQIPIVYKIVGVGALFFILMFAFSSKKTARIHKTDEPKKVAVKVYKEETTDGLVLNEDVDRKAFVARLEDQYYKVVEKNEETMKKVESLQARIEEMSRGQERVNGALSSFEAKLAEVMLGVKESARLAASGTLTSTVTEFDPARYRLDVVNIAPVEKERDGVYLPAGSFVRGTLLTGVYAPADQNNPLPVLIRLNEAFVGPNESRIPLEGAFVIAKATGDLNSERALIQGDTIASVLPSGETFQHKGNIGYVTDAAGQLGIKGIVVRNTGAAMAMSFMSGFAGGAASGLAEGEVTSEVNDGRVIKNVTGNVGKYAAFQGLSASAAKMAEYYQEQVKNIVPAVKVDAGKDVYLIILEGVKVYGLQESGKRALHSLD